MQFDIVIIGAGTAGCMVARQLIDLASASVCVIEAGSGYPGWAMHAPLASLRLRHLWSWDFLTEPVRSLGHRRIELPMGRLVGGTSSVNAMIAAAGHPSHYHQLVGGNQVPASSVPTDWFQWCKDQGIAVSCPRYQSPFTQAFLEACDQQGYLRQNPLDGSASGTYGLFHLFQSRGTRWSSYHLLSGHPSRSHAKLYTQSTVRRLIMRGTRAVGVEVSKNGSTSVIYAKHGVVLCAGAIHSPCILQRSGIGPKELLNKADIPVIRDLRGVGSNFQDHIGAPWVVPSRAKAPGRPSRWLHAAMRYAIDRRGVMVSNCCEAGLFLGQTDKPPEIEIFTHFQSKKRPQAVEFSTILLHPASRGHVGINPASPWGNPRICPNYLEKQEDIQRLADGLRRTVEIANTPGLQRFGLAYSSLESVDPGWLRDHANTYYHPGGTCQIDPGEMGVLNADFSVKGIEGLWVADNSAVPLLPGGHTAMTALWIGKRAGNHIASCIQSNV